VSSDEFWIIFYNVHNLAHIHKFNFNPAIIIIIRAISCSINVFIIRHAFYSIREHNHNSEKYPVPIVVTGNIK